MPGDATLLEKAAEVIKALNVKYEGLGRAPFFLLHRDGSDQLGPMLDGGLMVRKLSKQIHLLCMRL